MKAKIDFLIIGAQKSGTTSLHDYLGQHPAIFMPERKDIPFFVDAGDGEVREQDLSHFYRVRNGGRLLGGSFAHLLYYPESPGRIRGYRPDMRMIAILRNPIDRAYSAYWFARREGYETEQTFERALELEATRSRGSQRHQNELTYLIHGDYQAQLIRYFDLFDRSQLYICLFEDLVATSDRLVGELLSWLGVEASDRPVASGRTANAAGMPRSRLLQQSLIVPPEPVSRLYRRIVPRKLRYCVDRQVIAPLRRLNMRPFQYPPMQAATRQRLRDHFGPRNERLASLIGRDLSHWT